MMVSLFARSGPRPECGSCRRRRSGPPPGKRPRRGCLGMNDHLRGGIAVATFKSSPPLTELRAYASGEAVDDRPRCLSVVGRARGAEPEAHDLHLPALRSATPGRQRAHAAPSRGGSESAPTRSHRLRCAGAQCGQAAHRGRVAQDQAVLGRHRQSAAPRSLASARANRFSTRTSNGRTRCAPRPS